MMFRPLLSSLALLLTGCAAGVADTSAYPSLARRPVESADYDTPAATPAPTAPAASPSDDAELARYVGQAAAGATAFDKAYAEAQRLTRAASGAAVSSDPWVAAQAAISALESARNDSVSALAALDTLYTARVSAIADGKMSGSVDAIDAARASALAMVDSQNDRLDALRAMLAPA
ncbi:hypothetical protein [Sphingobium sp. CECT 9361]|uniref:hypothetical protein n=1 Tax=Sphingobium sp. CECT 9361 TaxID=2845384 RepID=UPI001E53D76B|nr:hypothetical protein [Sphingobium sp. CECT 9361]CAH0353250.1 hypothetical protein SPH9361_02404 [Sphingobium sp. CECT 9361]